MKFFGKEVLATEHDIWNLLFPPDTVEKIPLNNFIALKEFIDLKGSVMLSNCY